MQDPNIQRAQLLYQQERYDMAADACRQALAQMPQNGYAHSLLGLCLVRQGKYEEATSEARAGIHIEPDASFGHYALGVISQERNYFAAAESAARQALELSPEDADYWGLLSQTLLSQQRWKESLEAADGGLQFDPEHSTCLNLRAMALVKLGDKTAAAQTITEDLRRNPHNAFSHANQGWTLLHQNDHRQALEHFGEALRLDPNNEWAQQGMMQALKARYFMYRIMLRYYLWMSRFTSRAQWGLIIGLWVGMQVLQMIKNSNPAAAVFIYPILIGYALFVMAGWLADPIFNLTLMANRFGRYLLKLPQKVGAAVVAGLLLFAGVALPIAFLVPNDHFLLPGLFAALLTLSVAAASRCTETGQRRFMTVYTAAVAVAAIAGIALIEQGDAAGSRLYQAAVWGAVLSGFVAIIFSTMIVRK